jgi:hypothetical protein
MIIMVGCKNTDVDFILIHSGYTTGNMKYKLCKLRMTTLPPPFLTKVTAEMSIVLQTVGQLVWI